MFQPRASISPTRARLQSSFEGSERIRVQSIPPLCFCIKVLWRSRRNSKWSSIQFVFHYLYSTCTNVLVVINKVVTCHHPDSDKCSHFFAKAFPYLRFVGTQSTLYSCWSRLCLKSKELLLSPGIWLCRRKGVSWCGFDSIENKFLMLNYFSSIALKEKVISALVRLPQSLTANERV